MATLDEVMLPYLVVGEGRTLGQEWKARGELTSGGER
jgi:hypothetical protein